MDVTDAQAAITLAIAGVGALAAVLCFVVFRCSEAEREARGLPPTRPGDVHSSGC